MILEASSDKARLLVLLPPEWAGNFDLARRVYRLASCQDADVIYLVVLSSVASTLSVIREMVTMTALTSGSETNARYQLVRKAVWARTLKRLHRPQDTIVAPEELDGMPDSSDCSALLQAGRIFDRKLSPVPNHFALKSSKKRLF